MIDSVWTVGHHPSLCGTEKFGHLLAKKLGIPVLERHQLRGNDYPLVSVRASEVQQWGPPPPRFDLFLHDWYSWDGGALLWLKSARRVFAANPVIARQLKEYRPDVITAFAPSTIQGNPTRGTVNVLTFGMAHKIQPEPYVTLKSLLDDLPTDYTVSVSTAIHEGSPWDETQHVARKLRDIFGAHLRVLGYLADDALARELATATAVAVFYDPALRANNTTFWAAYEAGQAILTNLDEDSPKLTRKEGVFDIHVDPKIPYPPHWWHGAREHRPSWDGLLELLACP